MAAADPQLVFIAIVLILVTIAGLLALFPTTSRDDASETATFRRQRGKGDRSTDRSSDE